MTKHLGNILEPIPLMDRHGADARALVHAGRRLAVVGAPGRAHDAPGGRSARSLLTYWNTVVLPGAVRPRRRLVALGGGPAAGRAPGAGPLGAVRAAPPGRARSTAALEDFDTQRAGKLLAAFIDDLSNWYVRRVAPPLLGRRPGRAGDAARGLEMLTRLMAPMVPFITERVWQDLVRPVDDAAPESVHLAAWPVVRARTWSTRSWPSRWPWCAGWSSSAAPPARTPA